MSFTILSHEEVLAKIAKGEAAAQEFNQLLDDDTNLPFDSMEGRFLIKSPNDWAWAKAAFYEWFDRSTGRGPDKPRFAVGDMGTVWVDLQLAGTSTPASSSCQRRTSTTTGPSSSGTASATPEPCDGHRPSQELPRARAAMHCVAESL